MWQSRRARKRQLADVVARMSVGHISWSSQKYQARKRMYTLVCSKEVIVMLWLKSCPRCDNGDLSQNTDVYGRYVSCLQCAYYLTEAEEVVLRYSFARDRQGATRGSP
mgnify:CR=1 FL=1